MNYFEQLSLPCEVLDSLKKGSIMLKCPIFRGNHINISLFKLLATVNKNSRASPFSIIDALKATFVPLSQLPNYMIVLII